MQICIDHICEVFEVARWRGDAGRFLTRHAWCRDGLWSNDFLAHWNRSGRVCDLGLILLLLLQLLLRSATSPLVLFLRIAFVHCSAKSIEVDEERLREVGLDAPALVMNVVVSGVVGEDPVNRVPREGVAAVIKHGLHSRPGKEPYRLAHSHACEQVREARAKGVHDEALERVVVEGTIGVRHVEAVVARVKGD